jgi:hypothetical protein
MDVQQSLSGAMLVVFLGVAGCSSSSSPPAPPPGGDTCASDDAVAGCVNGTSGYSCNAGANPPDEGDPTLVCSEPTPSGDLDLYCCYTNTVVAASATCSEDFTVPCPDPDEYGFSCTGDDSPSDDYSNLNCSAPVGNTYCCTFM